MSGLFGSLNASISALNAQSLALQTAGKNLANVNNPNYARQRVVMGDLGTVLTPQGAQSTGLQALQTEQIRDALLDRQVTREISNTAVLTSQQAAYKNAEAGLGQSVDTSQSTAAASGLSAGQGSVAAALSDFFNAFSSLAASPTDTGVRQTLLQKAAILTNGLQSTDFNLSQLQSDLTTQANTDITSTNTILGAIANLNGQIARLEVNHPGSAVDLRDQRQTQLELLAGKMSFTSSIDPGSSAQVDVYAVDASGSPVPLVTQAAVTGPLTLTGSVLSAGSLATALTLSGGSIKGGLDARDGVVQTLRDQLGALSKQLVTSVNAAYNPTGTTGDFFTASGTTAATINVAAGVTPSSLKASDGGAAGDNTVANAISALASQSFSTAGGDAIDGTFSQFYGNAVSSLGQAAATATTQLANQTNIETVVRSQRDAVSGVSLDEESADLVKYQRSYEASARVISIIDSLLDTIIKLGT